MADWESHNLEELLRKLEETAPTASPTEDLAELEALGAALRKAVPADEAHFSLSQIQQLAQERAAGGESWQMPDHLALCPLCLEAFELTQEGIPAPAAATVSRYALLWEPLAGGGAANAPAGRVRRFAPTWRQALATAAVVALTALLGLYVYVRQTAVHALDSGLALASGEPIAPGAAIPPRTMLVAKEDARAAFRDGSEVIFEKNTYLSLDETLTGSAAIELLGGSLTATVTHKRHGRHFDVHTPLGDVVVVGTRFTVSTSSREVSVDEGQGDTRWTSRQRRTVGVNVQVHEGVVRVRSRASEASVAAGQTAQLRDGETDIEIHAGGL